MIVEQPKNQIIYDWLSFTTKIHTLSEVLDLLDFRPDTVVFKEQERGRYFYLSTLTELVFIMTDFLKKMVIWESV